MLMHEKTCVIPILLLISLPSKHEENKVHFYTATVGSKMHDNIPSFIEIGK